MIPVSDKEQRGRQDVAFSSSIVPCSFGKPGMVRLATSRSGFTVTVQCARTSIRATFGVFVTSILHCHSVFRSVSSVAKRRYLRHTYFFSSLSFVKHVAYTRKHLIGFTCSLCTSNADLRQCFEKWEVRMCGSFAMSRIRSRQTICHQTT